jgi:hypothetical protein
LVNEIKLTMPKAVITPPSDACWKQHYIGIARGALDNGQNRCYQVIDITPIDKGNVASAGAVVL